MIKIHINESEGEKSIPLPYFAIKSFLLKANEATENNAESVKSVNEIIKALKKFAKSNPGFVLIDIHDKDGTNVKITL
ncbi:MAG: hypothetical protein E7647_07360 [Ruminococcaceae bacterium]|nr:hypothetical protein [Oscillospiraceae bacterium]